MFFFTFTGFMRCDLNSTKVERERQGHVTIRDSYLQSCNRNFCDLTQKSHVAPLTPASQSPQDLQIDLIHQFGVLLSTTHRHFSCSSTTASLSVLTEKNSGPEILKTSLGQHLSNLVMVYRQYVCQFWMFAELQLHKY